jgi:hypothetical protein
MKRITQSLEYEGPNSRELRRDITAWQHQHPTVDNGIDWQFKYMYATMTDQDCLAFCLKHPQYMHMFKDV